MQAIKMGEVRYNAQIGAFEARVDIERNAVTFRYPCQLTAPISTDVEHVKLGLVRHALKMSDTAHAASGAALHLYI